MTNIEEQTTSNFVPEIAKLNKKNKILVIPIIISVAIILLVLIWIYLTYFNDKNEKNVGNENKAKSESEVIKKEFSFKKPEAKEPEKVVKEEHNFNIKPKNESSQKPIFKKYKSIPLKSEETTEATDSANNKESSSNNADDAIIATKIKIDPNFLIPVGTYIPCSLMTRFVSDVAGSIQCIISEDVYSSRTSVKVAAMSRHI